MARYNHPIYLLETFVEQERFRGTCYQAALVNTNQACYEILEQSQQEWPREMIDLLIEIKKAVDERRATYDRLDPVQIKGLEERYDRVIEDGMAENPSPISRGQP